MEEEGWVCLLTTKPQEPLQTLVKEAWRCGLGVGQGTVQDGEEGGEPRQESRWNKQHPVQRF